MATSRTSAGSCRCRGLHACWIFTLAVSASTSVRADTLADAISQWQARTARITSFVFVYDSAEYRLFDHQSRNVDRERPGEPFEAVLKRTVTLAMENNKAAYRHEGDVWDGREESRIASGHRYAHIFDGRQAKSLSEGVLSIPQGTIDDRPPELARLEVTEFGVFIPLWLWHDPLAHLERQGYHTEQMALVRSDALHDGRHCLELVVPRRSPDWQLTLYVDPGQDYLPVRYITRYRGDVTKNLEISYAPRTEVGWVVTSWTDTQYRSGVMDLSIHATLREASVNAPIEPPMFEVSFPLGAHIARRTGDDDRVYFVVAPEGLEPIGADDFGARPSTASHRPVSGVLLMVFAILIAIAATAGLCVRWARSGLGSKR